MRTHNCLIIVYYDLGIGGVQKKIVGMVNRLQSHHVYKDLPIYILLETSVSTTLASCISNPNVTLYHKPFSRIPFWLFITWKLHTLRPLTIASFLPYSSYHVYRALQWAWRRHIRFVIGADVITSHASQRNDFSKDIQERIPTIFSRANSILVPSLPIAQDLIIQYGIPKNEINIIPNWATARTKSAISSIDCIYAGRFDLEKRIPLMITLFARVKMMLPKANLTLVGGGKDLSKIKNIIAKNALENSVSILPATSEYSSTLIRAKIALITSGSEGIPMFMLEAMASGIPVVALHFPGIEHIIDNGKSGMICYTQKQFVQNVIHLLQNSDKRQEMGVHAKNTIKSRFSTSNIDRYIQEILP